MVQRIENYKLFIISLSQIKVTPREMVKVVQNYVHAT